MKIPEAFYDLIPIILNPQRILRMMPSLEDPMFVPTLMEIIRRAPHPYIKDGDDFSLQSFLKYSVLVSLHTSDRTITQLNRSRRLLEKVIQHGLSALDEVQRNSLMFAFRWVDALIRELGVTDPRYIPPILSTRIPLALEKVQRCGCRDVSRFLQDVGLT
jgi:hypothetical protein